MFLTSDMLPHRSLSFIPRDKELHYIYPKPLHHSYFEVQRHLLCPFRWSAVEHSILNTTGMLTAKESPCDTLAEQLAETPERGSQLE